MKKSIFIIIILFAFGCNGKSQNLSGIWIPKHVSWKDGSFSNFYFINDTVIIISSTQKKIKDSIYFQTEPGINVFKGEMRHLSTNNYVIISKALYRFIKMPDETGKEVYKDTVQMFGSGKTFQIKINGLLYTQGNLYTYQSKQDILNIVNRMVPEFEKHSQ